ncbi:MAG: DNA polymerase III subunit delta' [Lachnospiraceae bacterium]|uniref:DNA polymerase III subunit delta' n=1 Tax=uncultured Acetatifactor sp. TaxID=1671927 RepID=UPI002626D92D|nr:DNA polymerase III subunit delta' [uncultured Acetatifactor sp.]MCI8790274.1 DNA polymerase III subunit delta' [Lachnospiraceae bacterium]
MAGFGDIVGQQQIKGHLQNALSTGKISHAYIINGEKSSGKEFIAKVFAMALQCEEGSMEPCQECRSCKQALSGNHPDIIRVVHEKPNSVSVDDIRTQVNNDVAVKPYSSPYKVYIISEAEKMTVQAQNAILKTLEEPPAYAVILLLTDNVNSLLPTILSRCVVLNMKPVPDALVKEYLCSQLQVPDYKAEVCAAFARGNVGKAKMLATSEDFENIKAEALALLKYIQEMDLNEIVAAVKKITEYKLEIQDYLDICAIWYRDALLFKATRDMNHLIFREEIQALRRTAQRSSYEGIENIIKALDTAKRRLDANVNFELVMELLMLTIQENS